MAILAANPAQSELTLAGLALGQPWQQTRTSLD
jgi:hypothetical protein